MPLKCWMGKETSSLPFYKTKDLAGVWCPDDSNHRDGIPIEDTISMCIGKAKA